MSAVFGSNGVSKAGLELACIESLIMIILRVALIHCWAWLDSMSKFIAKYTRWEKRDSFQIIWFVCYYSGSTIVQLIQSFNLVVIPAQIPVQTFQWISQKYPNDSQRNFRDRNECWFDQFPANDLIFELSRCFQKIEECKLSNAKADLQLSCNLVAHRIFLIKVCKLSRRQWISPNGGTLPLCPLVPKLNFFIAIFTIYTF